MYIDYGFVDYIFSLETFSFSVPNLSKSALIMQQFNVKDLWYLMYDGGNLRIASVSLSFLYYTYFQD